MYDRRRRINDMQLKPFPPTAAELLTWQRSRHSLVGDMGEESKAKLRSAGAGATREKSQFVSTLQDKELDHCNFRSNPTIFRGNVAIMQSPYGRVAERRVVGCTQYCIYDRHKFSSAQIESPETQWWNHRKSSFEDDGKAQIRPI